MPWRELAPETLGDLEELFQESPGVFPGAGEPALRLDHVQRAGIIPQGAICRAEAQHRETERGGELPDEIFCLSIADGLSLGYAPLIEEVA